MVERKREEDEVKREERERKREEHVVKREERGEGATFNTIEW